MQLIDSHCHIHFTDYPLMVDKVLDEAQKASVPKVICVGCTLEDSLAAIELAAKRDGVWASIGIHPHEANHYMSEGQQLDQFKLLVNQPKVVAIGECGLDYFYNHSGHPAQAELIKFQIELAIAHNLPLIFHVREAFEDFWPILEQYPAVRGVVHSFSAGEKQLQAILEHGLYVGLNGIMTFTKDPEQLAAAKSLPLEKMILETDAPFLTPKPFRGNICEPKHVRVTAEFLAELRGENLDHLSAVTTANAQTLFSI